MLTDDLPWPELGNVSRGATRGNQGQKGALGPPDQDGRSVLQLRVQPGVLAVRLNRRSTEWYRTLDGEVNRALKLTKTYWRKARRRQDYDARADQDHMELHEWLQQLKDKVMSHLELLMQKGDIQGPPYTMPDDVELPFLRKFIDRHAAGIPHNPRLRNVDDGNSPHDDDIADSHLSEPPETSSMAKDLADRKARLTKELDSAGTSDYSHFQGSSSSFSSHGDSLFQRAHSSMQRLQEARSAFTKAHSDTQAAFKTYSACLDAERQARQNVTIAEKSRDDLMTLLLTRSDPSTDVSSRQTSLSPDEPPSPPRHPYEAFHGHQQHRHAVDAARHASHRTASNWPETESHSYYTNDAIAEFHPENHLQATAHADHPMMSRKHTRDWEQGTQPDCEDVESYVPRKRMHHIAESFSLLGSVPMPVPPQDMTLTS